MKPERLYVIIFDAVYGSSTPSYILFTLDIRMSKENSEDSKRRLAPWFLLFYWLPYYDE